MRVPFEWRPRTEDSEVCPFTSRYLQRMETPAGQPTLSAWQINVPLDLYPDQMSFKRFLAERPLGRCQRPSSPGGAGTRPANPSPYDACDIPTFRS
jgi:hypothetical protein